METVCNWLLLSNRLQGMQLYLAAAFYMHGVHHSLHAEFCIAAHTIKRHKPSFSCINHGRHEFLELALLPCIMRHIFCRCSRIRTGAWEESLSATTTL
jgi:hypothetical protein